MFLFIFKTILKSTKDDNKLLKFKIRYNYQRKNY